MDYPKYEISQVDAVTELFNQEYEWKDDIHDNIEASMQGMLRAFSRLRHRDLGLPVGPYTLSVTLHITPKEQ